MDCGNGSGTGWSRKLLMIIMPVYSSAINQSAQWVIGKNVSGGCVPKRKVRNKPESVAQSTSPCTRGENRELSAARRAREAAYLRLEAC